MKCYIFECPNCHSKNSVLILTYEIFFYIEECMECGRIIHVKEEDRIF